MTEPFLVYRFQHADGRAKDWAWRRDPAGTLTVRWGPAERLAHSRTYPASAASRLERTVAAKCRKGYVLLGERALDAQGRRLEPSPIPAHRTKTSHRPVPDLSRIDTGIPDGWF